MLTSEKIDMNSSNSEVDDADFKKTLMNSLTSETANLIDNVKTLRVDLAFVQEKNIFLELEVATLKTEITSLNTEIISLNTEITSLNTEITSLNTEIISLNTEIISLKTENSSFNDRLLAVESRDKPITIREAMRKLEGSICRDAAGSGTRYKTYCNIKKINGASETGIQTALKQVLLARHLTSDHITALGFLKKCGDDQTHQQRPVLSKSLWPNLLETALCQGCDENEAKFNSQLAQGLFSALEYYNPCLEQDDGPWLISGP